MTKSSNGELHDFYKSNGVDVVCHTPGPSMARQEFAEECDINYIMSRYEKTGVLPANTREPMYVDFTEMPMNLMDSMALMNNAEKAFMTLPAGVRREFENNPYLFVDYACDPANLEQMRAWGLAPPKEAAPEAPAATSGASAAPAPPAAPPAPAPAPAGP